MTCCKVSSIFRLAVIALSLVLTPIASRADPGVVTREDLVAFGQVAWMAPNFQVPEVPSTLPILDLVDNSPEAALLRRLELQGRAGGFANVIYDNHDRGHSLPEVGEFPRVSKLQFGDELKKLNLDYGLAGKIILPAIVIGNSSTAINNGKRRRSQPRLAMTTPGGPVRAFLTYVTNHLYIYPEHRDHDKADLFPANWPYMVITQGSSRSDKPFIRAMLLAVAAFSPDTQKVLQDKNLIAPTLQMVLRRSLKPVYTRQAYLSGIAHPTVFSRKELAPERMVTLASSIQPDQIPPMVYIGVEQEDFAKQAGLAQLPEILFDTPSAIARSWRGLQYTKTMTVSASKTADPNGHPLMFNWVLLRGDPDRVRIKPIGDAGAKAEISIDWHDTRKISPSGGRLTDRVDIGVFAWNGFHDSAPAMISVSFPNHQEREYETSPEGDGKRLISVDYDAQTRGARYDPVVYWSAPWVDRMVYDDEQKTISIERELAEETVTLASPTRLADGQIVSYALQDNDRHRLLSVTTEVLQ